MTVRAILLGLAAGLALATIGYLNDSYIGMTLLVGNHLPVSVYALVMLLVLTVNPVLRLLKRSWQLSAGELAVVLCLMLAAVAGTNGILRTLTPVLAMPAKYQRTEIPWQTAHVMSYVPAGVLVNDGKYDEQVIGGFVNGLSTPAHSFSLRDIPWSAWGAPLATWLPVIGLFLLAGVCLVLVVQRQWEVGEQVPFPIARFAQAIISGRCESALSWGREGRAPKSIFRSRGFWAMLAVPFAIHTINGIHAWYPGFINVPLSVDLYNPLKQVFPFIEQGGWRAYYTLDFALYFTVIGLTFFLARDVSLSVGLEPFLYEAVTLAMLGYGINPEEGPAQTTYTGFFGLGAFLGAAAALFWSGRRYYGELLRRAAFVSRDKAATVEGVWAARLLVCACAGLVLMLARIGLPWPIALLAVGLILLLYLVIARINAESGLFFFYPTFAANTAVMGLFGLYALGPQVILMLGLLAAVMLHSDIRTPMAPLLQNGLAVCRSQNVPLGRVCRWIGLLLLIALPAGLAVVLFTNYSTGIVSQPDTWAYTDPPQDPFRATIASIQKLSLDGQLASSNGLSTAQRVSNIEPMKNVVPVILIGAGAVLFLSFLRHRLPRWPIHPILFLIWGSWPMVHFGFSFLVGWSIRSAVTRFGGEKLAHQVKPLMMGLVAGELLVALFWIVVGWVYYLATGNIPVRYTIFPG